MKTRAVEYPHPVLNEYTNDYPDSSFKIEIPSHTDSSSEIVLELKCELHCKGLVQKIKAGDAKVILRVTCYRTSLREIYKLDLSGVTRIRIAKKKIRDAVDLQALIVATRDLEDFRLDEFNKDYFGSFGFKIPKGGILAEEPGLKIKLNTQLEKNMAGIVQVRGDRNASKMSVFFPETSVDGGEYIVITLPDTEYKNYARMISKRHLKQGVERFIHASLILPAIVEALGKLRAEETMVGEDEEPLTHFKGTIWADSIYDALIKHDIIDLSENSKSDYEIANMLLGNVTGDAINNLMEKLIEWSTIREEDPTL